MGNSCFCDAELKNTCSKVLLLIAAFLLKLDKSQIKPCKNLEDALALYRSRLSDASPLIKGQGGDNSNAETKGFLVN